MLKRSSKNLSRRERRANFYIALFLPCFLLGVFGIVANYSNFWDVYVSPTHWGSARGHLQSLGKSGHGARGVSRILYTISYHVRGRTYLCSDSNGCTSLARTGEAVREALKKAASSGGTTVYFDPGQPQRCFLDVQKQTLSVPGFSVGLFFLACTYGLWRLSILELAAELREKQAS